MKPLSNRELFWVVVLVLSLSAIITIGMEFPWWVFFLLVGGCCLGGRETLLATWEDRT